MKNLKIFKNLTSNHKLSRTFLSAAFVTALISGPAYAVEDSLIEQEIDFLDAKFEYVLENPFNPFEEYKVSNIVIKGTNLVGNNICQQYIKSFTIEEFENLIETSEETVIFEVDGRKVEINKQKLQEVFNEAFIENNSPEAKLNRANRQKSSFIIVMGSFIFGIGTIISLIYGYKTVIKPNKNISKDEAEPQKTLKNRQNN